jgi:hypothetical protein
MLVPTGPIGSPKYVFCDPVSGFLAPIFKMTFYVLVSQSPANKISFVRKLTV